MWVVGYIIITSASLRPCQYGNLVSFLQTLIFSDAIPKSYLLQVKGTSSLNCKAVQETFSASSLNTNDCFVLVDSGLAYVWYGKVGMENSGTELLCLNK